MEQKKKYPLWSRLFDVNRPGSCLVAAEMLTRFMLTKNMTNFEVIEGYITTPYDDSIRLTHTWIERNGKIIDPSKNQFLEYDLNINTLEYIKRKVYSPYEFMELCKKFPEKSTPINPER